jgi:hypothetical protein
MSFQRRLACSGFTAVAFGSMKVLAAIVLGRQSLNV